ncbi:hybrid sensor histidine kinase/response regulator [bacterium]|nr:MAG: hybrid sensor histidine kinase/response regulator [bacterium]
MDWRNRRTDVGELMASLTTGENHSLDEQVRAKLLLVDDRPENLFALQAILEPLGAELVLAQSGEDALRQVLRNEFALVLMDAQMPGLDGYEAAAMIRDREKTRNVPIIFVTAFSTDLEHVYRGYQAGAVDYISKPYNPDILRMKVQVFVDLYEKNEQIKRQAELLHQIELREAAEAIEREAMQRANEELERQVAKRTEELVEANREMEAFCYSVSHDLRTPLRTISATSWMLIEEAADRLNDDEKELLNRQTIAAQKLGNLIDDLLLLSRLGRRSLQVAEVDLTLLARKVADDLLGQCPEYRVVFDVQENLKANGDEGLLRVALENMLQNAAKYSPEGGTVTIGTLEQEGELVFFVRDEGIGFDMAYADKLFIPFERLHRDGEFEGTGIGLASVQRIISRHNGRVWADSEPQKGATFYFTLR